MPKAIVAVSLTKANCLADVADMTLVAAHSFKPTHEIISMYTYYLFILYRKIICFIFRKLIYRKIICFIFRKLIYRKIIFFILGLN